MKSRSMVVITKDVSKTPSSSKIKGIGGSEIVTISRKSSFRRRPVPTAVLEEEDYTSD